MKLKLFTAITIFFFTCVNAQQRQDTAPAITFEKSSDTLSKATGWYHNTTTGKWVENQNVLYSEDLGGSEIRMASTQQNFIRLYTKTVLSNGVRYYVLFYKSKGAAYEYPQLKKGLKVIDLQRAYLFTETEFAKLKIIKKVTPTILKPLTMLEFDENNQEAFLRTLDIVIKSKSKTPTNHTFRVLRSDEGNIRFTLPDYFADYSDYGFDKAYFETDEANFMKIMPK